jgi:hypothetical protein
MVFNATFNNISAISWRSVLWVDYPQKRKLYLILKDKFWNSSREHCDWLDINVKCKYFISYPKWAIIQIPKIDKYIFDLLPNKKCQLYNTNLTTLGNGIKHRDHAYCLTWIRRRHGDQLNIFDSFSFFKQYIQLFQQHMWWKIQKCHYCQLWKINTTVLYIS